ncbi:MAG: hydrogenase expression/formation protein HypE [Coriobacteriales bacterium]|jgi:hydrogenase expression/formation protein HypE|nr:hydrogenase expression/formation protein HypE [Coriobacteriales bacterium]
MSSANTVLLAHGSGGSMMHELIESFFDTYNSDELRQGNDAAVLQTSECTDRIAFSTDTFVVTPHFFPGGDIGRLAVCGTVNDVATSGAVPKWLSVGFILEEGFSLVDLRRICASMAEAAKEAGVKIVTGDTKVVNRGQGDGIYINTSGVGVFDDAGAKLGAGAELGSAQQLELDRAQQPTLGGAQQPAHNSAQQPTLGGALCKPGDKILLSGTLGDHGIAIISQRESLSFATTIESDAAPLNHLVQAVLAAAPNTRCFRDPTRGGLASTVNELATQSNTVFEIEEEAVPVQEQVLGACDMLGYDIFHVANEGKMIAVVPAEEAAAALGAMRASRYGENAAVIGEVLELSAANTTTPKAYVKTAFGSRRILDMLTGEQLPRIC